MPVMMMSPLGSTDDKLRLRLGAALEGPGVLTMPREVARLARSTAWAISSFCRLSDSLSIVPLAAEEPGVTILSFSWVRFG